MKPKFLLPGLLLLISAGSVLAETPVSKVETAPVLEREAAPLSWMQGTVMSLGDAELSTELAGRLTDIVETGSRVEQGDLVATLDTRELELELQVEKARLAQFETRLKHAEKQLERNQRLLERQGTAPSDWEALQLDRDLLTHEIELSRLRLQQRQHDIDRSRVRAPFPGVIRQRLAGIGEYLMAGDPLLHLVNPEWIEVSVMASETQIEHMSEGDRIPMRSGDRQDHGLLRSVIPVGDSRSRLFEVRIRPENPWRVGSAVEVGLINGPETLSRMIHRDALVLRPDGAYVFRVEEGIARRVPVTPGWGDATYLTVKGRLQSGEEIVVRGAERLLDGQKVEPVRSQLADEDSPSQSSGES